MCGFVGIIQKDKSNFSIPLPIELLSHRGPDDTEIIKEKNLTLGFWRLSIVDIDKGKQPMVDSDTGVKILFNGEVYNYLEIRKELAQKNHKFMTQSDTEVILKSYLEWGVDCFQKFEGMFSITIIDKKRNSILLARDRMGVKPLYYSLFKSNIIIASEQKAILKITNLDATINKDALIDYFLYQSVLGKQTLFKDIFKVKPGEILSFELDTLKKKKSDQIEPIKIENNFITYKDYKEYIRETILKQTFDALNTDLNITYQLSGGIDSNLLLAIANHFFPGKEKYSVSSTILGNFDDDEHSYIKQSVKYFNTVHRIIEIDSNKFFNYLDESINYLDEPVGDAGVVAQFIVNEKISEFSKIGIAGQGADELYFGYMRNFLAYIFSNKKSELMDSPFFNGWSDYKNDFESDRFSSSQEAYFNKISRFNPKRDYKSGIDNFTKILQARIERDFLSLSQHSESLNDFMVNTEISLQLQSLLQMEDRASMRYSVETRVPLCTNSILSSAYIGNIDWKFANDLPKGILRDAFSDIIPKHILAREKKVGRPIPLKDWLKEPKGKQYLDLLESNRELINSLFECNLLDYGMRHPNKYDRTTWALLSLVLWIKNYNITV